GEAERRIAEAYRGNCQFIAHMIRSIERLARALCGTTDALHSFSSPGFDERAFEAELEREGQATASCWYYVRKLQLLYIAGEHEAAAAAAREAQEVAAASLAMFPDFLFYSALTMAALFSGFADVEARGEALAMIRMARDRFAVWSEQCPSNFLARSQLLVAELARVEGRSEDALACYEQAQRVARTNGQVHIAAIGNECCARHFRARHMGGVGDAFLMKAARQYKQWGATAKVAALDPRAKPRPVSRPATTPPPEPTPRAASLSSHATQETFVGVEPELGRDSATAPGTNEVTQPGGLTQRSDLATLRRLQDRVDSPAAWRLGELVAQLGPMLSSDRGRALLGQLDELAHAQDRLRGELRRELNQLVTRAFGREPEAGRDGVDDTMYQARAELAALHTIADGRQGDIS
ncbi:MAG: hypothetical protein KC468_24275, partial [Myxococcales bacterium]|nr:hypothetical protein [Myxococcales bacterium]